MYCNCIKRLNQFYQSFHSLINFMVLKEKVQYFPDGHYWCEIDPINSSSAEDENAPDELYYKPPSRIKFSRDPIKQFSTYSIDDYDRRNEELDPIAASAEYELEKRVEKMDSFQVINYKIHDFKAREKISIFHKTLFK